VLLARCLRELNERGTAAGTVSGRG
jgi:hypothetical protein